MFRHFRVVLIPLQSPHSFPNFALPCRSHHTQSIHPGFPPLQDGGYCSTSVMLPLESSLLYAIHSPDIALPLFPPRSEEHTSELQSRGHLVCRLLLEKKTPCRL